MFPPLCVMDRLIVTIRNRRLVAPRRETTRDPRAPSRQRASSSTPEIIRMFGNEGRRSRSGGISHSFVVTSAAFAPS